VAGSFPVRQARTAEPAVHRLPVQPAIPGVRYCPSQAAGKASRPHRSAGHIDEGCTGGRSPASLSGPSQGTTRRPTAQSATARAHKGSSEERCETRGLVADRRLDPAALHSDGHLDQLDVAGTSQESVGDGLADGQHHVVSPRMAVGSCCKLVGRRGQPERSSRCGKRLSGYRPPPAVWPSWPGGGSCRPG
jgi:hypothetical protein